MVDSSLVVSPGENPNSRAMDSTTSKVQSPHHELSRQEASPSSSLVVGWSCVWDRLSWSNVSKKAAEIILQSWRREMQKQFNMYTEKWKLFCDRWDKDYLQVPVEVEFKFLTEFIEQGLSYSAVNSTRSALSAILLSSQCGTFGCHPWGIWFMKGVFHMRPMTSRYCAIWD